MSNVLHKRKNSTLRPSNIISQNITLSGHQGVLSPRSIPESSSEVFHRL